MYSFARRKSLAAAMILYLTATAPARSPLQASQTKEPTSSISGRVTIGGAPGRGVTVLLTSPENGQFERPLAKATTDQDGRFHLTGVPAGQHQLQAFAPALIAPGDMMWRSGRVINITAGEAIEGEDIALIRGAVITGRVSDADGQPIIQENVRLFAVGEQGRKLPIYLPFVSSFSQPATDDRGVYRLFGVPPGRYILAVGLDSGAPIGRMASGNTYYPLTYHPDVIDEGKATVIEVAAGGEATSVDIVLGRASKAYSASGRIIDADTGKPIVAMQYGCSSLDPQGRQVYSRSSSGSTSGARGEFRLDGLAPGKYSAYAVPNAESEVYSELAPFTVGDNDVAELEIKVRRGSSIIGNVIIEGAEGQPGAPRLSDVRVGISSGSMNVAPRGGLLSIAPDGSFRAIGLPRGIANFQVFTYPANKGLSLVRVERDGVVQKDGIEIGWPEEITGVKVVFAYGSGAIRGQVQMESGEIPAGAIMFLSLRRIGPVLQRSGPPLPDSRGRFVIDGLPPGEYELLLTFQVRAVADNPQINAKTVKQTVRVTNGAETKVTMVVDLNEKNQ